MSISTHYDVIVIGAGAAGLMAAGRAAERGKKVLLLEKNNDVGKKLSITGGGRCNILNAEQDVRTLLANYGDAAKFLYTPFAHFGMQATRDFFEQKLGLALVVEEGVRDGRARKRAFPKSNKASDVVQVLLEWCKKGGVEIHTGNAAMLATKNSRENSLLEAKPTRGLFREELLGASEITSVSFGSHIYTADTYILATGGLSHKETGSTGDGFVWLRELGHTVHEPTPTIVPLAISNDAYGAHIKALAGTTLPRAKITVYVDGVRKFAREGDVLCTHFGLSGPMILNCAGSIANLLTEGVVTVRIDLFPHLDLGALDREILTRLHMHSNKNVDNALGDLLPAALVRALIPHTTKGHALSREDRKHFVHACKNLTCEITGLLGFEKAVVADGGVPLDEIDTATFRSRTVNNLCIVGDLLHITRPSGGFSLQLCWTSGYLAGASS